MENRHKNSNKHSVTNFQDKFYHDYPSYRKEERREGTRAKLRRSDSSHSRRDRDMSRTRDKSSDRSRPPASTPAGRSGSVKRFSSQNHPEKSLRGGNKSGYDMSSHGGNWSHGHSSGHHQARHWTTAETSGDTNWRSGPGADRRRWGWVGAGTEFERSDFEIVSHHSNNNNNNRGSHNNVKSRHHSNHHHQATNDYVDMSSMDTSSTGSEGSSGMAFSRPRHQRRHDPDLLDMSRSGYNKIYVRHKQQPSVSRSRSISRPSPPRAKSVGNYPSGYPSRTHSFTSIYETRSVGGGYLKGGTSLDLRPLRTSLSSQGIFFTETGHLPRQSSYDADGPMSISLQDLQSSGYTSHRKSSERERAGRSLLDLCNVTINDSEIDKDDALLIVSIAKRVVEMSGDLTRTGTGIHGKVAGIIKDKVEQGLGVGGWQCIVGQKGTFGCCLAPAPNNYFNFDLASVTVLMFKAT